MHDTDGGVGQGKQRRKRRKVREPGGEGTKDLQMKERRDDWDLGSDMRGFEAV